METYTLCCQEIKTRVVQPLAVAVGKIRKLTVLGVQIEKIFESKALWKKQVTLFGFDDVQG